MIPLSVVDYQASSPYVLELGAILGESAKELDMMRSVDKPYARKEGSMQAIHNVSKDRLGKQTGRQNSSRKPEGYLCAVCGGERYHLVLTAEALNNRVGLKLRCGTCNASQDVIDERAGNRQHAISRESGVWLDKP